MRWILKVNRFSDNIDKLIVLLCLILKACSLVMAGRRIEDETYEVEKNSNLLAATVLYVPTSITASNSSPYSMKNIIFFRGNTGFDSELRYFVVCLVFYFKSVT